MMRQVRHLVGQCNTFHYVYCMVAQREVTQVIERPEPLFRLLVDGRKIGFHGIGVYTDNLLTALSSFEDIEIGVIFSRFQDEEVLIEKPWFNAVTPHWYDAGLYSVKEYVKLGSFINTLNYDIVHIPHYTLPFGVRAKTVVTVHDVIHITHPQAWWYPLVARLLIGSALKRASMVLTVSEASKDELLRLGCRKNVHVLPNMFQRSAVAQIDPSCKQKFFLAVVSTWKAHKGVPFLLEAFHLFRKSHPDYKLVLVGSGIEDALQVNEGRRLFERYANDLDVRGRVSAACLQSLYASAQALCMGSEAEGFGLPLLEAHAHNLPVVMRPVPALKELAITDFDCVACDLRVERYVDSLEAVIGKKEDLTEVRPKLEEQLASFELDVIGKQLVEKYKSLLAI